MAVPARAVSVKLPLQRYGLLSYGNTSTIPVKTPLATFPAMSVVVKAETVGCSFIASTVSCNCCWALKSVLVATLRKA